MRESPESTAAGPATHTGAGRLILRDQDVGEISYTLEVVKIGENKLAHGALKGDPRSIVLAVLQDHAKLRLENGEEILVWASQPNGDVGIFQVRGPIASL